LRLKEYLSKHNGVKIMLQVFGTVCIHRILPNVHRPNFLMRNCLRTSMEINGRRSRNRNHQWLPVGEVYWWEEATVPLIELMIYREDMIGTWIVTWIHWSLIGTLLMYHSNRLVQCGAP
jgi:hypothetical protein